MPDEPRVFPVGRLDADSEGLLILTNDGELAQRLTHPSFGVEKEYLAEVEGVPSAGRPAALRQGVELDDGMTAPATVGVVAPGVLRIVIHEGRNRQIRRMTEAVGHPVRRLVRTRIGPLTDPRLGPGEWRPLEPRRGPGPGAAAGPATPRPAPSSAEGPGPGPSVACGAMASPSEPCAGHHRRHRHPEQIAERMQELLGAVRAQRVDHDDLISIVFTATGDLVSVFPAAAARAMGLGDVPLLCARSSTSWVDAPLPPGARAPDHRADPGRAPPRLPPRGPGAAR